MIAALARRNLRHHARLLLALGLGLFLFKLLIVWFLAQIDTGPGLLAIIENFLPPQLQRLMMQSTAMASFAGGVGFGFQHPFVLVSTIAFVIVVSTIPAAERENGLLELFLARPVPRARYLLAVVALVVMGAVLLPFLSLLGVSLGLQFVEVEQELPWTRYIASAGGLVTLMLCVGGYSLWIGASSRRRGTAISASIGVTLVMFLLHVFAMLWPPLQAISWLSAFRYFDPITASVGSHTPTVNPVVLVSVFVVGVVGALVSFRKQEF